MTDTTIDIRDHHDGQLAEIILQPPPANVITSRMMGEITAALDGLTGRPRLKLIVFAGAGKHFSFGASVEEHTRGRVEAMLPAFHAFIGRVLACPVPTVAKVTGCCLGGGFELALACTFIFADEKAKFAVPEVKLGVFPPPACILLPARAGDAFASEMILGGEMLSASRLLERGVINAVAGETGVDAAVEAFFETVIRPKSAAALRHACTAARMSTAARYDEFIGKLERRYLDGVMSTRDANEGIASFIEKREPQWADA